MQVLDNAIQTSWLCIFSVRDITLSRLMRFTRGLPALSLPVSPIALAVSYVKGMQYPVQACEPSLYTSTGLKQKGEQGGRRGKRSHLRLQISGSSYGSSQSVVGVTTVQDGLTHWVQST